MTTPAPQRPTEAAVTVDVRVELLAELLESEFGWAVDAGWKATAASMMRKIDAATQDQP